MLADEECKVCVRCKGNLSKLKIDGEPPFPIREDRLHNKQNIMPECKIASVYAVYAVGAFIGRPH